MIKSKKILSLVLTVALLVGMLPISSFAATGFHDVTLTSDIPSLIESDLSAQVSSITIMYEGVETFHAESSEDASGSLSALVQSLWSDARSIQAPFDYYNILSASMNGMLSYNSEDSTYTPVSFAYVPTYKNSADDLVWFNNYLDATLPTIILPGMTDAQKVYAVYTHVLDSLVYGTRDDLGTLALNQAAERNVKQAFTSQPVVCEAYAYAMYFALNKLGIQTEIITGDAGDPSGPHMWNMVNIDGTWYHLDATWGDTDYDDVYQAHAVVQYYIDNPSELDVAVANYIALQKNKFFATSAELIGATHTFTPLYDSPAKYDYALASGYVPTASKTESDLVNLVQDIDSLISTVYSDKGYMEGSKPTKDDFYVTQKFLPELHLDALETASLDATAFISLNTGNLGADWVTEFDAVDTIYQSALVALEDGTVALPDYEGFLSDITSEKAMLLTLVKSVDGSDVETTKYWVSEQDYDDYIFILNDIESQLSEFPLPITVTPAVYATLLNLFTTEASAFALLVQQGTYDDTDVDLPTWVMGYPTVDVIADTHATLSLRGEDATSSKLFVKYIVRNTAIDSDVSEIADFIAVSSVEFDIDIEKHELLNSLTSNTNYAVDILLLDSSDNSAEIITVSFTTLDLSSLTLKISEAQSLLNSLEISVDGTDVTSDKYWVTSEEAAPLVSLLLTANETFNDAKDGLINQVAVDSVVSLIITAISNLESDSKLGLSVDKSALANLLGQAELVIDSVFGSVDGNDISPLKYWVLDTLKSDFTDKVFETILMMSDDTATQLDVDTLESEFSSLLSAINSTKQLGTSVDKTELEDLKDLIDDLLLYVLVDTDGSTTPTSKKWVTASELADLTLVYDSAVLLIEDIDATFNDFTSILSDLTLAKATFDGLLKDGTALDREIFDSLLEEVELFLDTILISTTGTDVAPGVAWVTQAVKDSVQADYNVLFALSNSPTLTQEEINDALLELMLLIESYDAEISVGATPNKSPLVTLLSQSLTLLSNTVVSTLSSLVSTSTHWVTQTVKDDLLSVRISSSSVNDSALSTVDAVTAAISNLTAAISTFTDARQLGTKVDVIPDPTPAPSPTPIITPSPTPIVTAPVVSTQITDKGVQVTQLVVQKDVIATKISELITESKPRVISLVDTANTTARSKFELNSSTVSQLTQANILLDVVKDNVQYKVPSSILSEGSKLMKQLNSSLDESNISVEINITTLDALQTTTLKTSLATQGKVLLVDPIKFEIAVVNKSSVSGSDTILVSKFDTYVDRVIELPSGVNRSAITGVVVESNGTLTSVPTDVFSQDGKWYARLKSRTNSVYTVISNTISVDSVKGHWSESIVNTMARNLVVTDVASFTPNKSITRGEFADYLVKALGLYRSEYVLPTTLSFSDVSKVDKNVISIEIAKEWGLLSGYSDGTFRAENTISRQEAMALLLNSMKFVDLESTGSLNLSQFKDSTQIGSWAKDAVSKVVAAGIFKGKSVSELSPLSTITHAESLGAIYNLLTESNLISK